ncbi:MAG: adenine phosphoribosyltransferase [Blastococcus sp.]|nr:adenine phosphoribosyltransferase [Blastococcus sp.]
MNTATLAGLVTDVDDFPVPGVVFKDITPLLASPAGYAAAVEALVTTAPPDIDVVLGLEARGFLFAGPVALALGAGFVPVRKAGKLPRASISVDFQLEYATATLAVHADAVRPGVRVLVVDDVLATGGTLAAAASLVRQLDAELVQASVLMELTFLGGRAALREQGIDAITSIITVDKP